MKTTFRFCFTALLWISIGVAINAQSFDFSKPDSLNKEQIHESVKHYRYVYSSAPWNINVIEVDLTDNRISLSTVKGLDKISQSREKLSQIVNRKNETGTKILAAINADFFYSDGNILNNQISNGEFVKGIYSKKSQFAVSYSNKPSIEVYNFYASVKSKKGNKILINACNVKRGVDSIVVFNHYWGETTNTRGGGIEYRLLPLDSIKSNLKFRAIVTAINDSNSVITNNNYILSCSGTAARKTEMFAIKDTVIVSLGLTPQIEPIKELFGGSPCIVKGGADVSSEQSIPERVSKKILTLCHPRTAIGFNKDKNKLYLVAVDGRQKISAGMSLKELSEFMIYIGCYEALNLDGGGSTTMIVKNKIVNFPSDLTGERKIGNALLLLTE